MSRATPDLTQGFTGVSLPKTGPRQMGTDADGRTSVITFLNQVTEAIASMHDNQTSTRPDYLPVNGKWCYTASDGTKTVYQYDGQRDVMLWSIDGDGASSIATGIAAAQATADAALPKTEYAAHQAMSGQEWDTGETWIDGRKIYAQVIDIGALPNATAKMVPVVIDNLDRIVPPFIGLAYPIALPSTGTVPLPNPGQTVAGIVLNIYIYWQ
ncbi:hypothetical protein LJC15_05205, partial [Desulfovibrio sp. OttesenSCG-928-G11]|nr:hypothetical protein [Desulfovibrio sp. OttesenSCG-928-G11]